ncbi:MAG: TVP38/TMEM64 family protein [Clostridiales bacterium]|nr:TVP38/TMEM64 family protein [Clostridiales bacterium]
MTQSKKDAAAAIIKSAVAMTLFFIAVFNYNDLRNVDVEGLVARAGNIYWAFLVVLIIFFVKSVLFILPASLVYVAVGAALETVPAVTINLIGIVLEVTVTYLLGLFLGGAYVEKLLSKRKKTKKLLEMELQNKPWLLMGIRFFPVFPIDFVSLFYGASKANFIKYLALSVLGLAPRVIAFTILGDALFEKIPMHIIIPAVICLIPVFAAWTLFKSFVLDKRKQEKEIKTKG